MMLSSRGVTAKSNRVQSLEEKHAAISQQIEAQSKHPSASDIEIRLLKKMKLALKEELEGAKRETHH